MEDISSFCGAKDTPVLDFWRRLPWVSKIVWILSLECFVACRQRNNQIHLWSNICRCFVLQPNLWLHDLCRGRYLWIITEHLLCRKICCVMHYEVEIWLILHSVVKIMQNTHIFRKWNCKVKFHMDRHFSSEGRFTFMEQGKVIISIGGLRDTNCNEIWIELCLWYRPHFWSVTCSFPYKFSQHPHPPSGATSVLSIAVIFQYFKDMMFNFQLFLLYIYIFSRRLQCSIKAESGCTKADLTDMGLDPNTNTNMYNKYCNKPKGPASASVSASASNTYQSKPGSYSSSSYKSGSYGGGSSYQPVSASKSSSFSSSRYQPSSSRGSYISSSSSYRPGSYTGATSYSSSRYRPSSSSSSYKSSSRPSFSSYKSSSSYTPGSSSYSSNRGSSSYKSAYKGYWWEVILKIKLHFKKVYVFLSWSIWF